ncbi:MAG: DNA polymerase/3'-5' exonuclease PolX, partial [Saprospiraceae bacterium]|nr:DNA polymerase/3'-5' exonuclease PolX [Saprospiraceae bacterium]
GIGPKTLQNFHRELGVDSKDALLEALESGEVAQLEGFGEKTQEKLLDAIRWYEEAQERVLLAEALEVAEDLVDKLKESEAGKHILKIEVAGSLRRRKSTVGDIDLLIAAEAGHRREIFDTFVGMDFVEDVVARGDTKLTVQGKMLDRDIDLRIVEEEEWGSALLYFTGSKEHNIQLRRMANEKDWKISEYGLFSEENDERIAGETEASIYEKLELAYVPPEMREDRGEIEKAAEDDLPELLELSDIRGDLHMHSTWSDGKAELKEIVEYVREHYDYEYIVMTDHTKSARIAQGLDEDDFKRQFEAIDKLNEEIGERFLKKGAEVDILEGGKLDLGDDILENFDWVVASIHSRMRDDNTQRLLTACEHPCVHAIGHPTGRLIGRREGYPLDVEALIEKAEETHTALEINAQPRRMDLEDKWARAARDAGVMLVIGTDSHNLGSYRYMKVGLGLARRAWCESGHVLNTRTWKEIEKWKSENT